MCKFFKWQFIGFCWKNKKKRSLSSGKSAVDRATVQQAGLELRQAYQVLSQVEDPDMVDYAVFTLQAAEKRYGYLVKKLKEQEKQNDCFDNEASRPLSVHCVKG